MSSKGKVILFTAIIVVVALLILKISAYKPNIGTKAIRIGSVLVLSGEYKSYGEQLRDGLQLAVDELNTKPDESPVEIIYYDSEGNKDLAVEKLKTLKERDGIDFVADIMGSGIALHSIPYITKHRMLVLSAVNTAPDLTQNGGPNFYRIIPSDGIASRHVARWSLDEGNKKGVIVYAADSWGTGLKDVLEQSYHAMGGELLATKDTIQNQTVFQPIVSELKSLAPEVVFLLLYPREAGLFLKEAQKQEFHSNFMGTDNFTGEELTQVGGDSVTGVKFVVPGSEGNTSEAKQHFLKLYQEKAGNTGKDPALFTTMGYDCAKLLVKVYKESNGDVDKAREILSAIRFDGASGPISFDKNNDIVVQDYARMVYVHDDKTGKIKAVPVPSP